MGDLEHVHDKQSLSQHVQHIRSHQSVNKIYSASSAMHIFI
jgi:hypothetical protein